MSIPSIQKAGGYYIWPGLQSVDGSGVLQTVLDGRTGSWWIGSGWVGSPTLPWGGGFSTKRGDTVNFKYTKQSANWMTTIQKAGVASSTTNTFNLTGKSFNNALVCIELHDEPWDFGSVTFSNLVIEATGTDTSWCTIGPQSNAAFDFKIGGIKFNENVAIATCYIESIVLTGPVLSSLLGASATASA
ncbi:hypothetical protein MMC13_002056 [Lambiella insularis]|nr:hypothetical protein [Lambiella insularis]